METLIQPQQPNIKNAKSLLPIVLCVLITALISGFGGYLLAKNSYTTEKQLLEQQITTLQTQINRSKSTGTGNTSPTTKSANSDVDSMFVNMQKELLQRDPNVPLTPSPGFLITTSILSNDKNKIVYSEISDCIKTANSYDINIKSCDWKYNIFVKDLQTGNLNRLQVNKLNAGGVALVYFPIAWSKNDQKIILEWGNPTSWGAGGAPKYLTYTINPNGGSVENLSTYVPIFLDNYSKVIFVDGSDKSPSVCGPVSQANSGKIVLTYIETGKSVTLLEEPNSYYSDLKTDASQKTLTYSINKVKKDDNACSEIDTSVAKQTKQVPIP